MFDDHLRYTTRHGPKSKPEESSEPYKGTRGVEEESVVDAFSVDESDSG